MSRKKRDFDPRKNWDHKTKPVKSTAAERLEFCRGLWTEDPHIPINGNKGMNQRLLEKFGKTSRAEQLMVVRSEVLNAAKAAKAFNPVIKPTQAPAVGKAKPLPAPPPVPPPPAFPAPLLKKQGHPIPLPPPPVPSIAIEETKTMSKTDHNAALGTTKSSRDVQIRYEFAKMYFIKHPQARNHEVYDAVVAEFGMGIGTPSLADIKEELGVGLRNFSRRGREYRRSSHHTAEVEKETRVPTEPKPKSNDKFMHTKDTAAAPIKAAIQMLLDEVPNLKSLDLQLDEDGKARVADFEVYSRAYETGSIEL